jgi:diguanylate cyclase (GGDEF)-like protein
MQRPSGKILLVEDTETVRQIIAVGLGERGYEVVAVPAAEEAYGALPLVNPDIILLDINLPEIDGYTVCKRIKSDPLTHHIPVIKITSLEETGFEIMAIEAGADDFVTKPIDPVVLDARINMIIRRVRRQRFANPLTGLPGGVVVDQRLTVAFESGEPFAVCHVDIDEFKAFNDHYGYARGDDLLAAVARIVSEAAGYSRRPVLMPDESSDEGVLVGHIGGDDFVYICAADRAEPIAKRIIERFKAKVPEFYDEEDRERGYLVTEDRRGEEHHHGILSVSVIIVSTADRTFWSPLEITDTAAELKAHAKSLEGSVVVVDRRRRDEGESEAESGDA